MPMTPAEIDEFLSAPRLAHFATTDEGGRPRIRPLWFLWKDGAFWFTTRLEARRTGRDLSTSQRVAVSVASEDRPYRAVIAYGRPEVVKRDRELLLAISTRYGDAAGRRWTAVAMREPDRVAMRMEPARLITWDYGKGDHAPGPPPPRRG
jgi:nitroimidazol reductase NimA-like FMN-containing flavoprotein (pyridoxamine 5'-phosphate oxidase superfamily)